MKILVVAPREMAEITKEVLTAEELKNILWFSEDDFRLVLHFFGNSFLLGFDIYIVDSVCNLGILNPEKPQYQISDREGCLKVHEIPLRIKFFLKNI